MAEMLLVAGSASRIMETQCSRLEAAGLARIARLDQPGAEGGVSLVRLALERADTRPVIALAAPKDILDAERSPVIARSLGAAAVELARGGNIS